MLHHLNILCLNCFQNSNDSYYVYSINIVNSSKESGSRTNEKKCYNTYLPIYIYFVTFKKIRTPVMS